MCRRRRGVGDGGVGMRGQSPAEVCVLAAGRRVSVSCSRVSLGLGRVREPSSLLHHSHTIDQAQVPGSAVRRYRLPAHGDQAAQSEPAREWDRRRLSGDQSRRRERQDKLFRVTGRRAGRHLVLPAIKLRSRRWGGISAVEMVARPLFAVSSRGSKVTSAIVKKDGSSSL